MSAHPPSASGDPLSVVLPLAITAALDAGRAILEIYQGDVDIEYKQDKSPLTAADRASHAILTRHLKAAPIRAPILSEEGRNIPFSERKNWDIFWLVDPLDGTKEFIKKNGEFTVNIALVKNGSPQLGIIYIPVKDTLYFGAKKIGAWKLRSANQLPQPVTRATIIKAAQPLPVTTRSGPLTVIGSRSHVSPEFESFMETMKQRHGEIDVISAGSSLKFCLVAEGCADIYPRYGPTMEWDTGAGQAIVEQAGGVVLDAEKRTPLRYNKESLLNPWFIVKKPTAKESNQ